MPRPNIVLLIAEELGQYFPGYAGNKDAETPNLDRLSNEGVVFSRHFTVHGKCVPSRAAMFSGRYCHNGGHRTLGVMLQEHEISLARLLKEHGYYNILALKNHTIADSLVEHQFNEHWNEGINGKIPFRYQHYTDATTSHERTAGSKYADNYLFGKINVPETDHCDYLAVERACEFIRNPNNRQPFFIDINFNFTHPPYEIMEPYYSYFMAKDLTLFPNCPGLEQPEFMHRMREIYGFGRLDPLDRKEMLACYYGQLASLDQRVGEIYAALDESGQLENTILIFTSDHGDLVGHYGIPEKWDTIFSDLIMNIPLLIRFPGGKHRKIDALTENIDLLPTLLELTGIPIPYGVQGQSLVPLLIGRTTKHKEYVFAEGGHEKELLDVTLSPNEYRQLVVGYLKKEKIREVCPDSLRKAKMLRTDKYKLVYRIKDRSELYDLEVDPLELDNLYYHSEYHAITLELEKKLLDHLIESEENLPFDPEPMS